MKRRWLQCRVSVEMATWIDYYKILQVHSMAEIEVIESAYKRLCRKYHPDVNKSHTAAEKIIQLNMAYEVLKDQEQRKKFHRSWLAKNSFASKTTIGEEKRSLNENLVTLENYFQYIANEEFGHAYGLISQYDKTRISGMDFEKWQRAVSKVFRIVKFECHSLKTFHQVMIGDCEFSEVIECSVKLTERNLRNRTTTQEEVTKYLVKEDCAWSVFVGFSQLQPLIDKFENLAESRIFPTAMEYWAYMQIRTDHVTGFPNREGFLDKARVEIARSRRYGNILTVLFVKLIPNSSIYKPNDKDFTETLIRMYASKIAKNIRETDILGVWDRSELVILLPETNLKAAYEAANKLNNCETIPQEYHSRIYTGIVQNGRKSLPRMISEARLKALINAKLSNNRILSKQSLNQ